LSNPELGRIAQLAIFTPMQAGALKAQLRSKAGKSDPPQMPRFQ
jgi:hypothetical protein